MSLAEEDYEKLVMSYNVENNESVNEREGNINDNPNSIFNFLSVKNEKKIPDFK